MKKMVALVYLGHVLSVVGGFVLGGCVRRVMSGHHNYVPHSVVGYVV